MKKVLMLALGITLTLIASAAYAQVTTGNVRGIVTDPNGAVVPNAKVRTTQNLAKSFSVRQVVELAQSSTGLGVYTLALIAPNVSSSGCVGVGSGGSVGGQRPRNNNFVVDGIDNNDKGVTGPQVYISPETVQEFNLLQNQYSAEFARSTGGQFILATKSGTNEFHGTAYYFARNRKLNAIDTLDKQPGNVFVRDQSQVNEAEIGRASCRERGQWRG